MSTGENYQDNSVFLHDRDSYFKSLKAGERFYVVADGKVKAYRFTSLHPSIDNRVIGYADANYATIASLDYADDNMVVLHTYDSYEVGSIIIAQLKRKIEHAKDVYMRD